jgi:hypothetical protein
MIKNFYQHNKHRNDSRSSNNEVGCFIRGIEVVLAQRVMDKNKYALSFLN